MWYKVVILEEGNCPRPRYLACDMFTPWAALNHHHPEMDLFTWREERKIQWLVKEEAWAGVVTAFRSYDRPLVTVV